MIWLALLFVFVVLPAALSIIAATRPQETFDERYLREISKNTSDDE